jgi:sister chromatid cohesion protein DCC1
MAGNQPVNYAASYAPAQYQLLELDGPLLQALGLDARGRPTGAPPATLVLRGEPTDGAVLCTASRTYQARQAEVSNTLLLLRGPDGAAPMGWEIVAATGAYVELLPAPARLDKLLALLQQWPYAGDDAERDAAADRADRQRYTLAQLREVVPASDRELLEGLHALEAFELDGARAHAFACDCMRAMVVVM